MAIQVQGLKFGLLGVMVFGLMLLMLLPSDQSSAKREEKWRAPGITHLVMFEFRENATLAQINRVCLEMVELKENCFRPNTQIPYILSATGGRSNSREGLTSGKTHAFVMQFENGEDRDYYVEKDPVHRSFIDSLGPVVASAQVIDFVPDVF